jgi:hypothetical protein
MQTLIANTWPLMGTLTQAVTERCVVGTARLVSDYEYGMMPADSRDSMIPSGSR